ncbi:MAG: hypothetical protein ABSD89_11395 [Halobacteriota archaeon]|jgi:hypothetical protein
MSDHEHSNEHHEFTQEAQNQQRLLTAVSRCCDTSPVKHVGERAPAVYAIIAALRASGHSFRFTDRGWVILCKGDATADLQKAVENVLLTDPAIGDRDSVAEQVRAGTIDIGSKSDLKTAKEKSDFITRFGLDAWARLPQQRESAADTNPATMTKSDYARLSVQQRIQLQAQLNSAANGNLREAERLLGQILHR